MKGIIKQSQFLDSDDNFCKSQALDTVTFSFWGIFDGGSNLEQARFLF